MSAESGEQLLSLKGLDAGYRGVAVVRDLNLEVGAGEVVALLGPNGAGKTTTLATVAGLLAPLGGEISFDGIAWPGAGSRSCPRVVPCSLA